MTGCAFPSISSEALPQTDETYICIWPRIGFCGFAAFRAVRLCLTGSSIYFEAMPPRDLRGVASKNEAAIGKAEPFRTEGGRAA